MIEAQSAYADIIPCAQIVSGDIGCRYSDTAQTVGTTLQRIEHSGVIAAMGTALYQHAARKSDGVEHAEILFERRVRRCVAAVFRVGKLLRRSAHMGMRIAGVRRWRYFRTADVARRQTGGNHRRLHITRPSYRQ